MENIKKMLSIIDQELKKKEIFRKDVAKRLGVSNGTVSNIFKQEHKISHMTFIELTRIAFGAYHHEFIKTFCREARFKVKVEAMEWAYANSDMDVLEILIEKDREQEKQQEDMSITAVYELQLQRLKGEITKEEFYRKSEIMKFDCKSMHIEKLILLNICSIYYFIDDHLYSSVWPQAKSLLTQVIRVENPYMQVAFSIRLKIALLYTGLRAKKYIECVEIGNELLNDETFLEMFPMYYNNVLVCLSEIYALSDYDKSIYYLNKAMGMVDEGFFESNSGWSYRIKSTSDFIHIHHNKFDEKLYLEALDEKAHFYAKGNTEDKKKALEILGEIIQQDGELDEFGVYYKALALNDLDLMKQAIKLFYIAGDFHYAELPTQYIENYKK